MLPSENPEITFLRKICGKNIMKQTALSPRNNRVEFPKEDHKSISFQKKKSINDSLHMNRYAHTRKKNL